jgi:hypothetical protein
LRVKRFVGEDYRTPTCHRRLAPCWRGSTAVGPPRHTGTPPKNVAPVRDRVCVAVDELALVL